MFCPQCHAEYRRGFTRCSDCDVDLVEQLTAQHHTEALHPDDGELSGRESDLRVIWKGHNQATCVSLCSELMKADIPYRVAQLPEGSALGGRRVPMQFLLGVLESDSDRAKELLKIEGDFAYADGPYDDAPQDNQSDRGDALPADTSPPVEEIRNNSYFDPWFPEDATQEIWSRDDGDDISDGIAMALKENFIHCRLDGDPAKHQAFVLPDDERRALEIVRQIIEGAPPE